MLRWWFDINLKLVFALIFFGSLSVAQWIQIPETKGWSVSGMVAAGESLIAACGDSVYIFQPRNGLLRPVQPGHVYSRIVGIARDDRLLYALTTQAIYRTTLVPGNWDSIGFFRDAGFCSIAGSNGTVITGTTDGRVFTLPAGEKRWRSNRVAGEGTEIHTLIAWNDSYLAGTLGEGVYRSDSRSGGWQLFSKGLKNYFIYSLERAGSDVLAGAVNGSVFRLSPSPARWIRAENGLPYTAIRSLTLCGVSCLAGTWGKGIYEETGGNYRWREVSEGLVGEAANTVNACTVAGAYIFAATDDGIWRRPKGEILFPIEQQPGKEIPEE